MVLVEDLLSSRGAILLAAGYVFEARVIRQVGEFAERESLRVMLKILSSSIKPPPQTQRLAARLAGAAGVVV